MYILRHGVLVHGQGMHQLHIVVQFRAGNLCARPRDKGRVTVGEFHQCAYKFDHWYNMVWMEKSLCERPQHPEPMIWFSGMPEIFMNT